MNPDGSAKCVPETLSDGECLRLMASVPVGRIVYTVRAMPAVEPVNFAFDNRQIVIGPIVVESSPRRSATPSWPSRPTRLIT